MITRKLHIHGKGYQQRFPEGPDKMINVPFVRLSGMWLAKGEFSPGDSISVTLKRRKLVIEKISSS